MTTTMTTECRSAAARPAAPGITEQDVLRQVIEQSGEGVLLLDAAGRILSANRAAALIFGCATGEMAGLPLEVLLRTHAGQPASELREALRNGRPWSGLVAARRADRSAFAVQAALAFARSGAGVAVTAILYVRTAAARQRFVERLKHLTITDDLTGVYNVRYLWTRLRYEFLRARRYGQPLCCLMADLDRFKSVNDLYGHRAGDEVLRHAANALRRSAREVDILARYGGEEFALVLPNTTLDGAMACAEHLRAQVSGCAAQIGDIRLRVTISVGVAALDGETPDEETLLRRADIALLCAKRMGRDRVCAAQTGPGHAVCASAVSAVLPSGSDASHDASLSDPTWNKPC